MYFQVSVFKNNQMWVLILSILIWLDHEKCQLHIRNNVILVVLYLLLCCYFVNASSEEPFIKQECEQQC